VSSTDPRTRAELEDELVLLDAHIAELRIARSRASYDLEHAVKERERLRRHLALVLQEEAS
jgi:hypothetical protein